jgi:hypothetical protein
MSRGVIIDLHPMRRLAVFAFGFGGLLCDTRIGKWWLKALETYG